MSLCWNGKCTHGHYWHSAKIPGSERSTARAHCIIKHTGPYKFGFVFLGLEKNDLQPDGERAKEDRETCGNKCETKHNIFVFCTAVEVTGYKDYPYHTYCEHCKSYQSCFVEIRRQITSSVRQIRRRYSQNSGVTQYDHEQFARHFAAVNTDACVIIVHSNFRRKWPHPWYDAEHYWQSQENGKQELQANAISEFTREHFVFEYE